MAIKDNCIRYLFTLFNKFLSIYATHGKIKALKQNKCLIKKSTGQHILKSETYLGCRVKKWHQFCPITSSFGGGAWSCLKCKMP